MSGVFFLISANNNLISLYTVFSSIITNAGLFLVCAIRQIPNPAPTASKSGVAWPTIIMLSDCSINSATVCEIMRARTRVRFSIGFVAPP